MDKVVYDAIISLGGGELFGGVTILPIMNARIEMASRYFIMKIP